MKTTMTRRTPAKKRTRNFFDHRPILRASSSHNLAEYKQVATRPLRTMHGTPRCGDNVIADLNASGEVVRSYVTPGLDSNVSMTVHDATTTTYYYNQDERQSVMNLTDDTGVVAQDYAYSAYGDKLRSQVSALIPNRYTYTGRELSDTTEDYYFRYRWYGADVGGFYSRDPLGYVDGPTVYAGWFASMVTRDPLGLEGLDEDDEDHYEPKPGPIFEPCTVYIAFGHGSLFTGGTFGGYVNQPWPGHMCKVGIMGCYVGKNPPAWRPPKRCEFDEDCKYPEPPDTIGWIGKEEMKKFSKKWIDPALKGAVKQAKKMAEDCKCLCSDIKVKFRVQSGEQDLKNDKEMWRYYHLALRNYAKDKADRLKLPVIHHPTGWGNVRSYAEVTHKVFPCKKNSKFGTNLGE